MAKIFSQIIDCQCQQYIFSFSSTSFPQHCMKKKNFIIKQATIKQNMSNRKGKQKPELMQLTGTVETLCNCQHCDGSVEIPTTYSALIQMLSLLSVRNTHIQQFSYFEACVITQYLSDNGIAQAFIEHIDTRHNVHCLHTPAFFTTEHWLFVPYRIPVCY